MADKIGVGIIGTGRRGYSLALEIANMHGETGLEVAALCNRTRSRMEETRSALLAEYTKKGISPSINLYENHQALVNDPQVDLVLIFTPQYAHKEPAVYALNSGKKVLLDKPMAASFQDARAIYDAEKASGNTLNIGFTRRYEKTWTKLYEIVQAGIIGKVRMMQVRDVVPYHIYFHTWHRRMEWSGGVIGDKASHFFDVFNWFAGGYPEKISAFGGQSVYLPDPEAPARCAECDRDCPYRIGHKKKEDRQDAMSDQSDSRASEKEVIKRFDNCVYLPGADIDDHGIVNISYPGGIKASLFWSVFGPDADDQETFELVGDKGRIILTRHTGHIDIISEYGKKHEALDERETHFGSSHFGADRRLLSELENFYLGKAPVVSGREGLEAVRMVEATHRSASSGGKLVMLKDVN